MERPQSPLVVFGPDHIDTSRAEMLVQCLSNEIVDCFNSFSVHFEDDKIKEKRYKLQKMIGINEDKKKRTEMMKNEKMQLTTKLATIEQENSVREQQLQSEQARIKELQLNIQMLDDHNNSIKRDFTNEERKYEQEKSILISKFERTKQKWTEIFKPQYEQSKVYQYLKQGDLAYNSLVERKESLLNLQKLAYKAYFTRRREFCDEKQLQSIILSMAKYFLSRRDQLIKIEQRKEKFIELEKKQKQLMESKMDKMKAWESVYTQPVKRDLMDFCLQTNIDQALTLSFTQMQQDSWSQPMTPVTGTALTPQKEQMELVPEEYHQTKSTITFQSPISVVHDEQPIASTITIVPQTMKNVIMESSHSSVLHLTTAIDDDDDELFSTTRRKMPIAQMEKMTIHEFPPSTQAFVVSKPVDHLNIENDREVASISQDTPTPIPSADPLISKPHTNVTFQLAPPPIHNRSMGSTTSSIQPQVTSNDVQQMLLTFSPDPSSMNEEQPQPMEDGSEQLQQQQRPTFSMPSSIESTTSVEDAYAGFNYNFGFDGSTTADASGNGITSPINFANWPNLGSPMATGSNDQFSVFLQQTSSGDNDGGTSFSFASFNYVDITGGDGGEASTDGTFGSFFFGNGEPPIPTNTEQTHDGRSN